MEVSCPNSSRREERPLPPRRGRVMIMIARDLVRSRATIASTCTIKDKITGDATLSSSSAAADSPGGGYVSDDNPSP
ncbi:PREDICTED: uncharacterized protein LOC109116586 [Tarenaya hassleriana]|uniref:uncharacterized protein LOC109116586 n=1 Tax=Tarenaya hassleriana TaxID=28532 RepID=UPI0008FD7755|nr:PREDICTED: uncharacterized protein LOC109116586 [Tarenaya hassleriana]